ncbi:amidohydrolase family protein [Actinocrispum sp. NPDC049592]|uniref:amidohydrolase family protein n=1 Tax=Actinocrispum sp. NPDC049592 TaxID=3154835 RepID=UPI0034354CF2
MTGIVLPAVLGSSNAEAAPEDVTVLTNATVIDGTGAPARHGMTVVLIGDRIAWIGRSVPPAGAAAAACVLDLRGKYVIPGLWDMHTHYGSDDKITIPLHIANGVTSVREMWGFPEIRAMRDRIDNGELLGPRFTIASTIIDGANSVWAPDSTQVVTAAEARAAVRQAKAEGADFLKIYTYIDRDAFFALADEARRVGLHVVGHHPARLRVRDVSDAGMRSFEHLYSMPIATSDREDEITHLLNTTSIDPANPRGYYNYIRELDRQAALAHNPGKAAALFERFARNGTWQSPTLTVVRVISQPADTYAHDPRLKYIDKPTQAFWAEHVKNFAPKTPEEIAQQREFLRFRLDMVRRMDRAGVRIIGGTDTPNPYVFPGFAAHDELSLLVQAGLSPMRALQTMTRDAATYLGLDRTMGTVSQGKVADLLVLDANPLADITNTQKIHAIFSRGRLITAEDRAKILADVEAFAASTTPVTATRKFRAVCACHA